MAVIVALAGAALLAEAASSAIKDPQWENLPLWTAKQLDKSYPASALDRGVDGKAVVECVVTTRGDLEGCRTVQESPAGEGFGAAALHAASAFRVKPLTYSGLPTAGQAVRVPIRFHLPWSEDDVAGERSVFTIRAKLDFKKMPTGADMARFYPQTAGRQDIEGAADLHCRILADGRLADCVIRREAPQGMNFGAATLKLAPLFRVDMTSGIGRVAEGKDLNLPVRWLLPLTHRR